MSFLSFFHSFNIFQQGCTPFLLHNYTYPDRKLVDLVVKNPQQFQQYIDNIAKPPLTALQKTTMVHLLYMHCGHLTPYLEELSLSSAHEDPWLHRNILLPYQNFVRKVIHSNELYQKVRTINNAWNKMTNSIECYDNKNAMRKSPKQYFSLELMYYTINLLGELFSILKHVCNLGRYYLKNNKKQIQPFVMIASYQAVLLYFAFKFQINQIIYRTSDYLSTAEQIKALKDILTDNLESINEQMKQLILNKYFNLPAIGIKIKLFELEIQDQANKLLLEKILGSKTYTRNDADKKYRKNRKELGNRIFKNGQFDNQLFETSVSILDSTVTLEDCFQEVNNKENNKNSFNRILSTQICSINGSQQTIESDTCIV